MEESHSISEDVEITFIQKTQNPIERINLSPEKSNNQQDAPVTPIKKNNEKITLSPSIKSNPNKFLGAGSHLKDVVKEITEPSPDKAAGPSTPKRKRLMKYSPFKKSPSKSPRKIFETSKTENDTESYIDFYDRIFEKVTLVCAVQLKEWEQADITRDNLVDLGVLEKFCSLTQTARNIYVRLVNRKHAWIKVDSLNRYSRVSSNIMADVLCMKKAGVVDSDLVNEDLLVLLNLLQVQDLKIVCKDFRISITHISKKEDIISTIVNYAKNQKNLLGSTNEKLVKTRIKNLLGDCIKLSEKPRSTFLACVVLVTLSLHSQFIDDLSRLNDYVSRIVRTIRGEIKFPSYELNRSCVFRSKNNFDQYLDAMRFCCQIEEESQLKSPNLISSLKKAFLLLKQSLNDSIIMSEIFLLPMYLRRYSAPYCYIKILISKMNEIKKEDALLAIDILVTILNQTYFYEHKKGDLFELYAQICQIQLKDNNKAANVLLKAFEVLQKKEDDLHIRRANQPNPTEPCQKLKYLGVVKYSLIERATTLIGRQKGKIDEDIKKKLVAWLKAIDSTLLPVKLIVMSGKLMASSGPGLKQIYVRQVEDGKEYTSVEEAVKERFREQGYCFSRHDEGSTLRSIIYALLWDIIYGKPKYENFGVFLSPYQEVPLDWKTPNFYERRTTFIMERFSKIEEMSPSDVIAEVMAVVNLHVNESSVINNWNVLSPDNVKLLTSLVDCIGVSSLVQIGKYIISDVSNHARGFPDLTLWNPTKRECIFVEVKSSKDRLSISQKVWLHQLNTWGLNAFVAQLKPTDGLSKDTSASFKVS